jgi:hypothetical protein
MWQGIVAESSGDEFCVVRDSVWQSILVRHSGGIF